MGKNNRSTKPKRSAGSLPKGLVHRKGSAPADPGNPFEVTARMKRPKYLVHNRPVSKPKSTKHALESLQRRQVQLRTTLKSSKKVNVLVDKRIGEYDPSMSSSDQMLARLVKERTRQSRRSSKFRLDDSNDNLLTHKGKQLDPNKTETIYSDDEDDYGNLEAVDTELHFGGARMKQTLDPYGGSSGADLAQVYGQRKTELDDLIARRKTIKAEKMQAKEAQVETVEKLDEEFAELSNLLLFRKDQPRSTKTAIPTEEEKDMNEWNSEMKQMMFKPKLRATDRTKTPEEIAKDEASRLHELETRRIARMRGDFADNDDLSDISMDGAGKRQKTKRRIAARNPDELSDSEDSGSEIDKLEARFTPDGLKYVDRAGNIVEKDPLGGENESQSGDESEDDSAGDTQQHPLPKGAKVQGNYRVAEQFDGREAWYDGEITKVHILNDGSVRYDVEYLDGDFEEDLLPENVRPAEKIKTTEALSDGKEPSSASKEIQLRRNKARDRARTEMPYIFEVPTTLEALHEIIARYALTGKDATTIIERIYGANSVRLDHRNTEKMQNFYDVLLRRFIAVGDSISESGDGGEELGRVDQLHCLTKVLYAMAQDFPEAAGAVWSRRVGIFQNAHAKRLRDLELLSEDEGREESPWLSPGTFLLLKASSAIFPGTDKRHYVATPVNLFLGQILSQTPIMSSYDIVLGILCCGLLLENGIEAKRVAPEALGFLSGVIRLFSNSPGQFPLPCFESAYHIPDLQTLRSSLQENKGGISDMPSLKIERDFVSTNNQLVSLAILGTCLQVIDSFATGLQGSFNPSAEPELFGEVSQSLLTLRPKDLPTVLKQKLVATASSLADLCPVTRVPLRRQAEKNDDTLGLKTLAPRMEDPERYTMSKDFGKKSVQVAIDRTRREYKREHKSISRELRIDAAFIENDRRLEQTKRDSKAQAKRQKNFAWLEGEAATLNQQVAQGGGLLKGGGMGAAKAKAASGKLGIKKGGKF